MKYHKVLVVDPDVYAVGGKSVFEEFASDHEKPNLIVVPRSYLQTLARNQGTPAREALNYASDIAKNADSLSKPVEIRSSSNDKSGLSVLITDDRQEENLIDIIQKTTNDQPVFITNDPSRTIDHRLNGRIVEEAKYMRIDEGIVHEGIISGPHSLQAKLYEEKFVSIDEAIEECKREELGLHMNQFIRLPGDEYARVTGDLVRSRRNPHRINSVKNMGVKLIDTKQTSLRIGGEVRKHIWGISPRNKEQFLAFQYGLLNPDVSLMFLTGEQGSGKTLLSYVAAFDQTVRLPAEHRKLRGQEDIVARNGLSKKSNLYKNMILLKPTNIMGGKDRDLGFLPGDLYDKLIQHYAPFVDAHKESELNEHIHFKDMVLHPKRVNDYGGPRKKDISLPGDLHLNPKHEAIGVFHSGYARGRSLPNSFILVDEAQNFTPYEMRTLVERAANGSKMVIMGDPFQQDNPQNSTRFNGLTYAMKYAQKAPYSMMIHMNENFRAQMSEDTKKWAKF